MKRQTLINGLWVGAGLTLCLHPVQAQMIDMMGNIGVSGTLIQQDAQNIGTLNKSMRSQRLIDDLAMKTAEILTTYMGNYRSMPTQTMTSAGTRVTFQPDASGQSFTASMTDVPSALCKQILKRRWEGLTAVRLNGQTETPARGQQQSASICQTKNSISLIFQ